MIHEPTINRPGLVLTGFTRYFAHKRIQVIGNAEAFYLKSLPEPQRLPPYREFLRTLALLSSARLAARQDFCPSPRRPMCPFFNAR